MNKFYIYKVDDKFVKVTKNLKLRLVPKIESYWGVKKQAKSWNSKILTKYPTAELCEAELNEIEVKDKNSKIIWGLKDEKYFSDNRCEFVIYKNENYWILNYTDSWTINNFVFFNNIKASGDNAVIKLKKYAQKIFDHQYKQPKIEIEL